jgi:nucleoside-diphosphate-sugar epimerase
MRVFITGASGFVGRALIAECIQRQWDVCVLQHTQTLEEKNSRRNKYDVVTGDITDPSSLAGIFEGVDILFHCAAALGGSLISEEDFYRINSDGTRNVLQSAKDTRVPKIVHFSSAGVLGTVPNGEVADETYAQNPQNSYDKSKLEGEKIARIFAGQGMDIVIIRPGWVYGPGDRRTFKLLRAIAKKRFILVTKGEARQTPVHIDDLIEGVLLCAEKAQRGEIYHIAGSEVLRVRDICATIAAATGSKIPSISLPLWPVNLAAVVLEKSFILFKKEAPLTRGKLSFFIYPKPLAIQKARQELGYSPKTSFKEGITQTVEWCKVHNWL